MGQQVNVYRKLQIGTSTSAVTVTQTSTANVPVIEMYTTSSSTSASISVEPIYMKSTMTGAAGVGGRARFHLYTNVALGGWSNALKAYAEYGASGRTAGLGSALCAELVMSAGTSSGTYAPLESEISFGTTGVTGTATSFLYMNTAGTNRTNFDTSGYLFELGAGLSPASGKMIYDNTGTDPTNSNGSLRFRLPSGASAYLMYYDQEAA